MSEHTKTPWVVDQSKHHVYIWDSEGRVQVHYHQGLSSGVEYEHAANARHIVHCVNNHERLVEALVNVKAGLEAKLVGSPEFTLESMIEGVSRALAALEAEKGGEL